MGLRSSGPHLPRHRSVTGRRTGSGSAVGDDASSEWDRLAAIGRTASRRRTASRSCGEGARMLIPFLPTAVTQSPGRSHCCPATDPEADTPSDHVSSQ